MKKDLTLSLGIFCLTLIISFTPELNESYHVWKAPQIKKMKYEANALPGEEYAVLSKKLSSQETDHDAE